MTIDTSREIQIEASPMKLLRAALGGVLLTATSLAIALHWLPDIQHGSFVEFIGYAGAVLFPAATLFALWRALTTHGPVVTLSREGIRDRRLAPELIPWSAVGDITVWKQRRQRSMILSVDPTVEAGLTLSRLVRWTRNANRAVGVDGLWVSAGDLKSSFDELLATTLAFAQTSRSREVTPQTLAATQDGTAGHASEA